MQNVLALQLCVPAAHSSTMVGMLSKIGHQITARKILIKDRKQTAMKVKMASKICTSLLHYFPVIGSKVPCVGCFESYYCEDFR